MQIIQETAMQLVSKPLHNQHIQRYAVKQGIQNISFPQLPIIVGLFILSTARNVIASTSPKVSQILTSG